MRPRSLSARLAHCKVGAWGRTPEEAIAQLTRLARDLDGASSATRDQIWIDSTVERLLQHQHDILHADTSRWDFWWLHYPRHVRLDTQAADVFNDMANTFEEIWRIMTSSESEEEVEVEIVAESEEAEDGGVAPPHVQATATVSASAAVPVPWSETDPPPPPCVVCMVNVYTHAFLPCGHKCVCANCATKRPWSSCPMCFPADIFDVRTSRR